MLYCATYSRCNTNTNHNPVSNPNTTKPNRSYTLYNPGPGM